MDEAWARASEALEGASSAMQGIKAELELSRQQLLYWKGEAVTWKSRCEQECARSERLRRALRCGARGGPGKLAHAPSLIASPRSASTSAAAASFALGGVEGGAQAALMQARVRSVTNSSSAVPRHSADGAGMLLGQARRTRLARMSAASMNVAGWDGSESSEYAFAQLDGSGMAQHSEGCSDTGASPRSGVGTADHDAVVSGGSATEWDGDAGFASMTAQQQQQQQQKDAADVLGSAGGPFAHAAASAVAAPVASTAAAAAAAALEKEGVKQLPAVRRAHTLPRSFTCSASAGSAELDAPHGLSSATAAPAAWRSSGVGGAGGSGGGRHTVDQLLSMMMAFTLMRSGGPGSTAAGSSQDGDELPEEDMLPSVSLDDDDGSSGVGLAAAAAVSAAMARAWASAASREQRAVAAAAAAAAAAGAGGGGGGSNGAHTGRRGSGGVGGFSLADGSSAAPQRAGFRLVATVTTKMGKRPPSSTLLSSSASQESLLLEQQQQQQQQVAATDISAVQAMPAVLSSSPPVSAEAAALATGRPPLSPSRQQPAGPGPNGTITPPSGAVTAAARGGGGAGAGSGGAATAAAGAVVPSSGQASAICLHWLSRPRTVLVMRKPSPSTEAAFLRALAWLRRHRITVFVEPTVFQQLLASGRAVPWPHNQAAAAASAAGGAAGAAAAETATDSGECLCAVLEDCETQQVRSAAPVAPTPMLVPAASWPAPPGSSNGDGAAARAAPSALTRAPAPSLVRTWRSEEAAAATSAAAGMPGAAAAAAALIPESVAQQLDLAVVLGGDGTVLWTCHIFGNRSIPPLVPFNLGSLGFLTPFDPDRLEDVLLRAFKGGFPITLRHRLHATIVRAGDAGAALPEQQEQQGTLPCVGRGCLGAVYGEEHVALNEVVIERGMSAFLTNLECFCDGAFVTHVQGDGLILGTPTGSTAYSLAAGGSMVHPQVPCILFTPISPHSLSFRPLMFPDYCQLCIQVPRDSRGHVWASFDGKDRTELCPGDAVVARLSRWPVPSVAAEADPSSDWFSAVRECLHWNVRKLQSGAGM